MDDIKDAAPCTLMYIKGRTSITIEVIKAIMMPSHILHGWSILAECVVVELTTTREGHEFKDLDNTNEEEGIEKLVDAKGTPQRYYCQNPFAANCFATEYSGRGSPTSNMSLPAQDPHTSVTPPAQDPQDLVLQDSMRKRLPSPPGQDPNASATPPSTLDTQDLEL
jgi:hypothetical protein